jgi:replicative DNA helicase
MDIERALISKALNSGELAELVARGIDPDHFIDDDMADIYDYAVDQMSKHAAPPSMSAVREEFRSFKPLLNDDPLSWHMEVFVRHVKERLAVELVRDYHDDLEDPQAIDEIELRALEMARKLAEVVPAPKAQRFSEGKQRRAEYERRKKKQIVHGIKMGIPTFDNITLGIQPHELMIWGGPPGGGKTTFLQYVSMQAYLAGHTVLFISLEVEAEQILRKFDTMLSKVRYLALKGMELEPDEEEKWHAVLDRAEEEKMDRDIIIIDDIRNCTVDKVAAQQIRHKPGMVVVDYLEEMRTPRNIQGWEGVASNGRGLKQAARVTKTPHVTATQLNRDGDTAYQSAQKIADMLIILQPPDEDAEDQETMKLVMRKYRDGPSRKPVTMRWKLDMMDIEELPFDGNFQPRTLGGRKKQTRQQQRVNPWTARHRNGHGPSR